ETGAWCWAVRAVRPAEFRVLGARGDRVVGAYTECNQVVSDLVVLRSDSGAEVWRRRLPISPRPQGGDVGPAGGVVVVNGPDGLVGLAVESGRELWTNAEPG